MAAATSASSRPARSVASRTADGTLVILGAESGPVDLGKMLIAAGWAENAPFAITWNGTTTDQHTVVGTLGTIGADLKAAGVSLLTAHGPAVAVVGEGVAAQPALSWFETKPLFGWRVLVPRTKEQADEVCSLLRARGAVPEQVPTIAVEPPRTPQQMERAVKGLVTGRYQWIGFTSVNAVRAIREKFEEYGLDARAFAGVKVAAVGEQTARALREFGIMPDLVPEGEQSAEGLADAWPAYDDILDPINRVLLPRADIATEGLLSRLTELGWEAEDVTAYRTVRAAPPPAPIREAIKGGGFDAVLFTSSSTVRNLIGIAGKPHAVTVIAVIGPQTAKTAAEFGLRVDVVAEKPSVDGAGRGARGARCEPAGRGHRGRRAGAQAERAPPRSTPPDQVEPLLAARSEMTPGFPVTRARRLRRSAPLRRLVAQVAVRPSSLVLPLFVKEGIGEPRPVLSMPGVVQHTRESLRKAAVEAVAAGVGGLILFGIPAAKDGRGSSADDPDGIVQHALRDLAAEVGHDTVLMADLCLDEYTDHGHCGLLTQAGEVDNDATLARYASIAVAQAAAGVHVVAPSGMMDGQVGAIRAALDSAGRADVAICAYSAKYASAFYGPFRDAAECAPQFGDRAAYQQDPAAAKDGLREALLDVAEGADIMMVKPALAYLDVISQLAASVQLPVAAYQVSGEYAMVEAAAANGWLDRDRTIMETLTAISRAGADIILTYWAAEVARWLS